ncbi:hypothetical protein EYE40_15230 [Glaciihabitans arcticus]|uniref:WXG100 family type VII secretion target n=1 Tax=Glaciihabitans arcticus TaxID=2668039 RepID=A0A4Q9GM76_9MICO|nr:hypothetical protein [Glaciihabitans arcticus]TBN55549.1 hypothetical protein EYE40_15230 [Glaciihabitans arcticus]
MSSSFVRVDPFRLAADGDDIAAVAEAVIRAWTNVENDLAGTAGMAGDDEGAENWARDYDELGKIMNNAAMGCVTALQSMESMLVGTARAYNNVEGLGAGKGATSSSIVVSEPTPFIAHNIPSAIGQGLDNVFGDVAEFLEEKIAEIGLVFPRGDTDKLRTAKGDWEAFSRDIDSAKSRLSSAIGGAQASDLPHTNSINNSLTAIEGLLGDMAGYAQDEADQLEGIITAIDDTRHELQTMITALLLEIAVGAGISIALSFVTFGGAAAVGAGAAAIRIGKFVIDVAAIIRRLASLLRISGQTLGRIVSLANKFKNGSFLWRAGFEAGSGVASSVIANFGADIINGNEITPTDAWGYILGGAAGGIVGGPLAVGISRALPNNLGVAIGGNAVEGAVSNVATEGVTSAIKGEEFNPIKSAITGGIGGAVVGGVSHGVETGISHGSGNAGGSGGGTPTPTSAGGGNSSVNAPTVDIGAGGGGNAGTPSTTAPTPTGGAGGGGTPGGSGSPDVNVNTPSTNVTLPPAGTGGGGGRGPDGDGPSVDGPSVDSPTSNTPTVDAPTVDSPTVDSPTVDSPTVDAPTVDSPTVDSPTADSPTADSPTVDSPTTDSPSSTDAPTDSPSDTSTDVDSSTPTDSTPSGDGPSLGDSIGDINVPDVGNFHLDVDAPPTDAPGTPGGDGPPADADSTPEGDTSVADDIADITAPDPVEWQTDFDINDPKPDVDVTPTDSTDPVGSDPFFGDGGPTNTGPDYTGEATPSESILPRLNGEEITHATRLFGAEQLPYYLDPKATYGLPGSNMFASPDVDTHVPNTRIDSVLETGLAESATNALIAGGDIFGVTIPLDGIPIHTATAAHAGNWPHFLPGGHTAYNLEGHWFVNETREFVIKGGFPLPPGTIVFKLLEGGVRDIIAIFG